MKFLNKETAIMPINSGVLQFVCFCQQLRTPEMQRGADHGRRCQCRPSATNLAHAQRQDTSFACGESFLLVHINNFRRGDFLRYPRKPIAATSATCIAA